MSPQEQAQQFLAELPARLLSLLIQMALAAVLFWVIMRLTRLAQRIAHDVLRRARPVDNDVLDKAIGRIIYIAGVALAIFTALALLGINVSTLLASLGITSLVLGFALKDTIEQAISGTLLLFQQPFKVGDVIEIDNVEGVVADVGIRTTNVRTFEGVQVMIPNNRVFQSVIRNKSYYSSRRFELALNISTSNDLIAANQAMLEAVKHVPGVLAEPAPAVAFENFTDAAVRTIVRYWIDTTQGDAQATRNSVTRAITSALAGAGIASAYPVAPSSGDKTDTNSEGVDTINKALVR
jgi:small conductance mechanosensitive channel